MAIPVETKDLEVIQYIDKAEFKGRQHEPQGRAHHMTYDPIISQVNRLGDTLREGQEAEGKRALMAYQMRRQADQDALAAPGLKLQSAEAADELAKREAPVRVSHIFGTDEAMELATWKPGIGGDKDTGKVEKGEPSLLRKFGDMFDAEVDVDPQSGTYGAFVNKKTRKALTHAEVNRRAGEVEALFVANMGLNRTMETMARKMDERHIAIGKAVVAGQMSSQDAANELEGLRAARAELRELQNDPARQIELLEQKKAYLSQFSGNEFEKAIARVDKSIDERRKALERQQEQGAEFEHREKLTDKQIAADKTLADRKHGQDKELLAMRLSGEKSIERIRARNQSKETMPAEVKLAEWYAQKKGIPADKAWETITAQKNFGEAVKAYNDYIESKWAPGQTVEEAAAIQEQARSLFLSKLPGMDQPTAPPPKQKSWKDVYNQMQQSTQPGGGE
jgi:hypothetical protein